MVSKVYTGFRKARLLAKAYFVWCMFWFITCIVAAVIGFTSVPAGTLILTALIYLVAMGLFVWVWSGRRFLNW